MAVHAGFKSDVLKYQNIMNLHAFKIRGDFCRMQTVKTQIRHDITSYIYKGRIDYGGETIRGGGTSWGEMTRGGSKWFGGEMSRIPLTIC